MRLVRSLVVSLLATVSMPAFAQYDAPPNVTEKEAKGVGRFSSDEIVVTAQRREQSSLDAPLAVTAVSAESLENQGIRRVLDLTQTVPGLKMDKIGGGTQAAIRGITTQVTGPGSDSNVAIYVDGVYQPLTQANDFRFPDLERVEVLKGPQGSLYGRNATGGAIRFLTKEPSFTAQGKVSAQYASYNDVLLRGFVSGPLISEVLAASLSASFGRSDGYVEDLLRGGKANPEKSWQVRGKLLWNVTNTIKAELIGHYSYLSDPTSLTALPLDGNTIAKPSGVFLPSKPRTAALDTYVFTRNEQAGIVGKLSIDLGFASLSGMSAYTDYRSPYQGDGDFSPLEAVRYEGAVDRHDNVQHEVLLTSNADGGIEWIVGANYYDHNTLSKLNIHITGRPAPLGVYKRVNTEAVAVFGEATIPLSSRLSAIAGLRYTKESVKLDALSGFGVSMLAPLPRVAEVSWGRATPRLTLKYEISDRTNVYATYSEGFKSGTLDPTNFAEVKPETLKAFEIGLKTREISGVSLDLSSFYYDYKNQQVQSSTNVDGVPVAALTNAAGTEIYGLDGEISVRISPSLRFKSGLSLLHAKFTDFPNAVINVPTEAGPTTVVVLPNAKGKHAPRSPAWTLSFTADYSRELAIGRVGLSATAYHSDTIYYEYGNRVKQKPYTTLDARASWRPNNSPFELALFGRNLTDTVYISSTQLSSFGEGVVYSAPRTIGVEAALSF